MKRDCRSPKLAASIARNGPPDHSVRLWRSAPDRFDDLFHHFGRISVRRMFGGEGIFVGDLMIGLVSDERIYLKTGGSNRADFEAEGCKPFSFPRGDKMMVLPYHAVPERLLDDAEEFGQWAQLAHEAALAARASKGKKRKR